ncbi:MAG: alpha-beta hydrolase superfamily lysophospholipase [Bacteroidia bacterium]
MTPEQLSALRQQLPCFGSEGAQPSLLQAFCRFYGIDFAEQLAGVSHHCGTVESGEFNLAVHYWQCKDARANLLLMHGYFDHTGLYGKLIGWALAAGCNVLMFDLPGHGLSTGQPAVINDFGHYSAAIDDVLQAVELPEVPLWAMGQSTGCAALTDYARHFDWPFAATVLLAPLVRPASWGLVRAAYFLTGRWVDSVPRTFTDNTSDREFLEFIRHDPMQCRQTSVVWVGALRNWLRALPLEDLGVGPVQVVQGDNDATVDWRYNLKAIVRLYPHSRVLRLVGAGHQLANESEAHRYTYLKTITAYLRKQDIELKAQV